METISEIINRPRAVKKKGSERSELISFFVDNVKDRRGKKYRFSFIASKLSHLKVRDLYFMISEAKDYERRGGCVSKYFWGSLKAK